MGHFHSQDLFAEVETKPKEHTDNAKVQDVTVEAVSIKIDMEGKKTESPSSEASEEQKKLMNMSMMTAIAINLHNFPEGLATFAGALVDPTVGVALAIAIGIHNIPEVSFLNSHHASLIIINIRRKRRKNCLYICIVYIFHIKFDPIVLLLLSRVFLLQFPYIMQLAAERRHFFGLFSLVYQSQLVL